MFSVHSWILWELTGFNVGYNQVCVQMPGTRKPSYNSCVESILPSPWLRKMVSEKQSDLFKVHRDLDLRKAPLKHVFQCTKDATPESLRHEANGKGLCQTPEPGQEQGTTVTPFPPVHLVP